MRRSWIITDEQIEAPEGCPATEQQNLIPTLVCSLPHAGQGQGDPVTPQCWLMPLRQHIKYRLETKLVHS